VAESEVGEVVAVYEVEAVDVVPPFEQGGDLGAFRPAFEGRLRWVRWLFRDDNDTVLGGRTRAAATLAE